MAKPVDYYAVLGISPQATAEEIKKAYHKKAKQAHPDAGGSLEAMQAVNEAYRILSSPLERRDYDHSRQEQAQNSRPGSASSAPNSNGKSSRDTSSATMHGAKPRPEPSTATPPPVYTPSAAYPASGATTEAMFSHHHAEQHNRSYARWSVWRFVQEHGPISLAAVAAAIMLMFQDIDPEARKLVELVSFIPFYGFAICIVFLLRPHYLIEIHFTFTRQLRYAKQSLITILGILIAAIPCGLGWLWFLNALSQVQK